MNEERPLKIWGQPEEEVSPREPESKEAPLVTQEREIVLTDLHEEEPKKKGFFRKRKKSSGEEQDYTKVLTDLKQMDHKERLDYIKDSSARTRSAAMQSEAGQRAAGMGASLRYFLKTYRGKRLMTALALVLVALVAVSWWMKGSDLREGIKLCEQGNYVDAQIPLKNAVQRDNMNPKTYNMLGLAYLGSGEYEDALNQFSLARNLDPKNQEALRGLGITYCKTGEYKEAVEVLEQALDQCGINVNNKEYDIMWYRAEAETGLKDYKAAAETYSAIMELEGASAAVYYYRGAVYCKMNDKERALADFDEAIKAEGNGYDLYFDIYNSLLERGWSKEAEAYMSRCKEPGMVDNSNLSQMESDLYQGMMLYLEGSYKESVKKLSVSNLRDNYQALTYKALAYEKLHQYKKALTTYKNILELFPSKAESYNGIALYMLRRGKEKKAIYYLEYGVNSCPAAERRMLYYNMVTAYEQAGDFKGAQDALRQYGVLYGQSKIRHENYYAKERDRS